MTRTYKEDGSLRDLVAFDYETFKTTPNLAAPRAVCCSFATFGKFPRAVCDLFKGGHGSDMGAIFDFRPESDELPAHYVALVAPHVAVRALQHLLASDVTLVAQNGVYDLGVTLQHAHLMELLGDLPGGSQLALHELILDALDLDGTGLPGSEGRMLDTMVREILIRNASGSMLHGVDLGSLVKKYLQEDRSDDKRGTPCSKCNATGKVMVPAKREGKYKSAKCPRCLGKKYDTPWREKYHLLDGVPFKDWPDRAIQYAITDSVDVIRVAVEQAGDFDDIDTSSEGDVIVDEWGGVTDEAFQVRAMWSLRLAQMNGPRSNAEQIAAWSSVMEKLAQEGIKIGQRAGFIRDDGTKNTKVLQQIVSDAYDEIGVEAPLTPTGRIKTDEKAIRTCGNKILIEWQTTGEGTLAKSKFIPAAELATKHALASKPHFFVSTGRTSWAKPCLHQPPRKAGFRECWQARPGNVYASCDWSGAEMVTMAQIQLLMFGHSDMADAINAGKDLHIMVAVSFHNAANPLDTVDYDEALKRYKAGDETWTGEKGHRQLGKIANFGFMGGMAAYTSPKYPGFVSYAEGYGVVLTPSEAEDVRNAWLQTWGEMQDYLDFFKSLTANDGFAYASWVSGMIRGCVQYTNGCNHGFQALVAVALKLAMWWVTRETFSPKWGGYKPITWEYPHSVGDADMLRKIKIAVPGDAGPSPLYGWRMWLSIHDEILIEGPEETGHDAAMRLSGLMEQALKVCTPDLNTEAEPTIMTAWSKKAKTLRDENGRLQAWSPDEVKG